MIDEQAILVTDTQIQIFGQFFIHKDYSVTKKDLLLDVLARCYTGQQIVVSLLDGESIDFSGFKQFMQYLCDKLSIPYTNVTFETHDSTAYPFLHTQLKLGIFISVNHYLPKEFNRDLANAKFVGSLLGRYNINRLRLSYELDTAFPGNTFITFQPDEKFITDQLRHVVSSYTNELAWFKSKTFDRDLTSRHFMGMIDWQTACEHYGNVWNKYQIEVISETDCMDSFWFTEKTANCLATGKPFVLMNGQGSLQRLRDMGFTTFSSVLDETYDNESNPYDRILHITSSLQSLYNSPSRAERIRELYQNASQNIIHYQQYAAL
jgi:hypothetical protein